MIHGGGGNSIYKQFFIKRIFAITFFSFNRVLPCCTFRSTVNINDFHSSLSFSGGIIDAVRKHTQFFRFRRRYALIHVFRDLME